MQRNNLAVPVAVGLCLISIAPHGSLLGRSNDAPYSCAYKTDLVVPRPHDPLSQWDDCMKKCLAGGGQATVCSSKCR